MSKGSLSGIKKTSQEILNSLYDPENATIYVETGGYTYSNRVASSAAAGTSAQVKAVAGVIHGIAINKTTTGSISLYDAAAVSAAASFMWVIPPSTTGFQEYRAAFSNGLNIMATSAWDYTVMYR